MLLLATVLLLSSCGSGKASLEQGCEDEPPHYVDADGDGFGDDATEVDGCDVTNEMSDVGGDCDDSDVLVNPGTFEVCGDGIDNDCDGLAPGCELSLAGAQAKLVGEESGSSAGNSVSGAGDVNGDGVPDMLVGAPSHSAGAAYLVLGPVTGTVDLSLADARLTGQRDRVGYSVSGAGDVDGDGEADLIVGTEGDGAYIVMGPVTGAVEMEVASGALIDGASGELVGFSVAGIGDVDGDGWDEVLVGAPGTADGGTDAGAAYLLGRPLVGDVDVASARAAWIGEAAGDAAGRRVRGAGDVDGDGEADLLIGAPYNDAGGTDAGAAYLVHKQVSGVIDLSAADATLVGEEAEDRAGGSVSGAGDVDGDGNDDILVGAYTNGEGGTEAGAAYLLLGPVSGTVDLSMAHAKLIGHERFAHAGNAVAGVGDVDGDGDDDIAVAAAGADGEEADMGAVYLVLGLVSGTFDLRDSDVVLVGEEGSNNAGDSLSGAGDVDGDGVDDILVGAPNNTEGGNFAGAAYLVLGLSW